MQELQAPQVQQESAPQALPEQPAYKALQVLVLPAQRECKAPLVLPERQVLPALA